jgi:hypothetical protein
MKRLSKLSGAAELRGSDVPTLVTFGDPTDPSTARVIRPDEFRNAFGTDVRFGGAFLEMTSDPLTRGISHACPGPAIIRRRSCSNAGSAPRVAAVAAR